MALLVPGIIEHGDMVYRLTIGVQNAVATGSSRQFVGNIIHNHAGDRNTAYSVRDSVAYISADNVYASTKTIYGLAQKVADLVWSCQRCAREKHQLGHPSLEHLCVASSNIQLSLGQIRRFARNLELVGQDDRDESIITTFSRSLEACQSSLLQTRDCFEYVESELSQTTNRDVARKLLNDIWTRPCMKLMAQTLQGLRDCMDALHSTFSADSAELTADVMNAPATKRVLSSINDRTTSLRNSLRQSLDFTDTTQDDTFIPKAYNLITPDSSPEVPDSNVFANKDGTPRMEGVAAIEQRHVPRDSQDIKSAEPGAWDDDVDLFSAPPGLELFDTIEEAELKLRGANPSDLYGLFRTDWVGHPPSVNHPDLGQLKVPNDEVRFEVRGHAQSHPLRLDEMASLLREHHITRILSRDMVTRYKQLHVEAAPTLYTHLDDNHQMYFAEAGLLSLVSRVLVLYNVDHSSYLRISPQIAPLASDATTEDSELALVSPIWQRRYHMDWVFNLEHNFTTPISDFAAFNRRVSAFRVGTVMLSQEPNDIVIEILVRQNRAGRISDEMIISYKKIIFDVDPIVSQASIPHLLLAKAGIADLVRRITACYDKDACKRLDIDSTSLQSQDALSQTQTRAPLHIQGHTTVVKAKPTLSTQFSQDARIDEPDLLNTLTDKGTEPYTLSAFKLFMKTRHRLHYVTFWLDVSMHMDLYRRWDLSPECIDRSDPQDSVHCEKIRVSVQKIVSNYLGSTSQHKLPIPKTMVLRARAAIFDAHARSNPDVFKDAKTWVSRSIKRYDWPLFVRSVENPSPSEPRDGS